MSKIIYNLLVSIVVTAVLYGLYSHNVNAQTANIQYNVFITPELHSRSWVVFTLFTEIINSNLTYSDFLKLKKIIECESGYNVNAIGDSGKAFGLGQFWENTFNEFKQKAERPEFEYKNPLDQIKLMIWAYKQKKMYHWWTCWTKSYPEDTTQHF
jgi:hypothetical protein